MPQLRSNFQKAKRSYIRKPSSERLRAYLTAKARLGLFDKRMCAYYGVNPRVNKPCKKAICRAYVVGLVPTATTGGEHAPGSWHYRKNSMGEGCAVDFGNRKSLVGTSKGFNRLVTFQRKEFWRRRKNKIRPVELIGPINHLVVLKGSQTTLAEGSALETQHDNHVHEAYNG